ncbi:MAG: galactokinase, partial [Ruminococcus sp.]
MKINEYLKRISDGSLDGLFGKIYKPDNIENQKKRYIKAVEKFSELYPECKDIHVYSASGRTEITGNHTDHQHGCVIAGAVDLDAVAVASFNNENIIRIKSEGYKEFSVSLDDLEIRENKNSSSEIVRGICARFIQKGIKIGGFDMYTTSDVIGGSGISSSACFETLIATALNCFYNNSKLNAVEIAKIGQYAENVYFGKKSGLMDQLVCSAGGFVFLDFENTENPKIEKINFDLSETGYELIITDTMGNHSDLTDDYVAVRNEMESVAEYFGKKVLREVDEKQFWENIPDIRKKTSDRAVLRAVHFFADSKRAEEERNALSENRFDDFLKLVNESGESSTELLQNLYSCRKPTEQAIPLAIMTAKKILDGKGAV